ncbi:MAG: AAA family ATPase [Candidatus Poribacteria bacterium]|nr:AAA family ATPase [Candidatus Poribacteria bacterium]
MRLKRTVVKDFKRFTDLTVEVPETARLIMLVGPNGCGKSSFFDALHTWHRRHSQRGASGDHEYYDKTGANVKPNSYPDRVQVEFYGGEGHSIEQLKKSMYFRSAHRNDPDVHVNQLQRFGDPLDQVRISRTIDNDVAVSQNYQKLAARTFGIYDLDQPVMTNEFTKSIIGPVQNPITTLFPDLALNGLSNPMVDGTFRFTKGVSKGFHFKNLSGGEKAAFDLVLDLVVAREAYNDTLFCIDEPESHMNMRIQANLLSILYDLTPNNCQLMLATHSIGMMRRAKEIEMEEPSSIAFLDFGDRNFDQREAIKPATTDRAFWNKAYEVALDDLAALVAPEQIIICEGEPKNRSIGRNFSHDARCYEQIFKKEFPDAQFVPGGNAQEVIEDKRGIAYALGILSGGSRVIRLIDRNSRSPEEVAELKNCGVRVLTRRNLESYLFDDEILRALSAFVNKEEKAELLLNKKMEICANRVDDTPDDLKPASGEIYLACKEILNLSNPGNDAKTFMRDTLSPLVSPKTETYGKLKFDIFDAPEHESSP